MKVSHNIFGKCPQIRRYKIKNKTAIIALHYGSHVKLQCSSYLALYSVYLSYLRRICTLFCFPFYGSEGVGGGYGYSNLP